MSSTTPYPFAVQRIDLGAESTLVTAANANDMRPTNFHPFDFTGLEAAALENLQARAADIGRKRIPGKRTGRINLRQYMHGWKDSAPTAAPTVSDDPATPGSLTLMDYLGALLGNRKAGGYNGAADLTGSTTSALSIDDATGFETGFPILVKTGSSALAWQVMWITDVTQGVPDVLTFLQTALAVDATHTTVHGGIVAYTVEKGTPFWANGTQKGYTGKLYGAESDDLHDLLGMMPLNGSLILTAGELPLLETEWGVSAWSPESTGGAAADVDYHNGDAGAAGDEFPDPEPFMDAWVTLSDASAPSAASQFRVENLRIDFNCESTPISDPNKLHGVAGFHIFRRRPRVSFSVHRDYSEEVADWLNGTEKCFSFQFGSGPGKIIAGVMPECYHIQHPVKSDNAGMVGSQVVLEAGPYADDTGSRSDSSPLNQAFRLAVL